jgi:uncharacterized DUF497 family protein
MYILNTAFDWDAGKAAANPANLAKHAVSFEEAAGAFDWAVRQPAES